MFDDDGTIVKEIRENLKIADKMVRAATANLDQAVAETLLRISLSEDTVSKALAPLFARAEAHKPEELERARVRNARGIPPGKKAGAVGDELNWEQFLSFVTDSGKRRLWIISRDSDYCLAHGKQAAFLVPSLRQELMRHTNPSPSVYAFRNIPDGVKHFSNVTGVKADNLPTAAKVEQIKKEQAKLPPSGSGFWDEPEANLNPKVIKRVARTILQLCQSGIQVFVASHSLFLLRELDILLKAAEFQEVAARFFGLHPGDDGVVVRQGDTVDDIGTIDALQEELSQSDRYLAAEAE